MVNTEKTKVGALLDEIIDAFADSFVLPKDFLLGEYNRLAASLALLCPVPDTKLTVTAENGRIACALTPAQYRRVFLGERVFFFLQRFNNECFTGVQIGQPFPVFTQAFRSTVSVNLQMHDDNSTNFL